MKVLTSFTSFTTSEGRRISYTYSEVDEKGNIISQNNRENFILLDKSIILDVQKIEQYINESRLEG